MRLEVMNYPHKALFHQNIPAEMFTPPFKLREALCETRRIPENSEQPGDVPVMERKQATSQSTATATDHTFQYL